MHAVLSPYHVTTREPPGVVDLDSDGMGVEAGEAGPVAFPRVPGLDVEGGELGELAVPSDHQMRRGPGFGVAQPADRALGARAGGIVEHEEPGRDSSAAVGGIVPLGAFGPENMIVNFHR